MFEKIQISIFLVSLFVGASCFLTPFAFACSCLYSSEEEYLQRSDVAFFGLAEKIELTYNQDEKGNRFGERHKITFHVDKVLKGALDSLAAVQTPASSAACGFEFETGKNYFVYADKDEKGVLWTGLCSGTREKDSKPIQRAEPPLLEPSPQEKFVLREAEPLEPSVDEKPKLVQPESSNKSSVHQPRGHT